MATAGVYNSEYGFAFSQETVSSTALALSDMTFTDDELDAAASVTLSVTGNPVRFTSVSGVTPTASEGNYLAVGSVARITGTDMQNFLIIRATGSDASVAVTLNKL